MFGGVFLGKKVVVTGHTGFKGSWLVNWLLDLGADVLGIALDPESEDGIFKMSDLQGKVEDIRMDIRDSQSLDSVLARWNPDFVFHLAAQALVKKSYAEPIETWSTNVMGSLSLLHSAATSLRDCTVVMVTSDKCYENQEWVWGYRETDRLGGIDPYSASKAACEIAISSYFRSFHELFETKNIKVVTARAGNVIGGGDWAVDRIVPDCFKAWNNGVTVKIRNPNSTRPWQHVLEPLSGYLRLAQQLSTSEVAWVGESFNFGPSSMSSKTVSELVNALGEGSNNSNVSQVDDSSEKQSYEAGLLGLNCDKASCILEWRQVLTFDETVELTAAWYRQFYEDRSALPKFTRDQISNFCYKAKRRTLSWAQY